jgi:hypothetical protein
MIEMGFVRESVTKPISIMEQCESADCRGREVCGFFQYGT